MACIGRGLMGAVKILWVGVPSTALSRFLVRRNSSTIRRTNGSSVSVSPVGCEVKQTLGIADHGDVLSGGCLAVEGAVGTPRHGAVLRQACVG